MFKVLRSVLRSSNGATAIEYGLIIALIAISAIVAMQNFGNATIDLWDVVKENIVR